MYAYLAACYTYLLDMLVPYVSEACRFSSCVCVFGGFVFSLAGLSQSWCLCFELFSSRSLYLRPLSSFFVFSLFESMSNLWFLFVVSLCLV